MGNVSPNDSLYAEAIEYPHRWLIDLDVAQCFGSPDRSALLKNLTLDFLPVESLSAIPNFTLWLDLVVDYLNTRDVHYLDAPATVQ